MLFGFRFEQTKERETERGLIFGFQNSFYIYIYIYIYICLKEPVSFNEIN